MTSIKTTASNTLQKLNSTDYKGEWINVTLGNNKIDRRFIKPQIVFENPSGNAICLGNGLSRQNYTTKQFENTNKRKILKYYNVMYGCNAIYRDWQPDFLIVTNQILAAKISTEMHNITFAPQEIMRRYKNLNLIPGAQRLDAGSAAAYLAAFHGAKRVFLYGYDGQQIEGVNNNVYANTECYSSESENVNDRDWIKNLKNVIETYNDVEFFRVAPTAQDSYRVLQRLPNYNVIDFRKFISFADL